METVLVVGREWKFRALLRAQLREEGYEALAFETLGDAEAEQAGAAALVFDTTDAGGEWLPALRRLAHLPAVVVAGADERLEIERATILRRPVSVGHIVSVVREVISGHP